LTKPKTARKWILPIFIIVVILTSGFVLLGLQDMDHDGANGFSEWFTYNTGANGPFVGNSLLNSTIRYGRQNNITDSSFIVLLYKVESGQSQYPQLTSFFDFINNQLIPQEARSYFTSNEIINIKANLLKSVLQNGEVDSIELQALETLKTERWWIVKDIINSGMINSVALNENWDNDSANGQPLNNIDEIMQKTNPLNRLEVTPNNQSNRYAVIADAMGFTDNDFEVLYQKQLLGELIKNGYTNQNIYFVFDPGLGQRFMVNQLPIVPDFQVTYDSSDIENAANPNYNAAVESRKTEGNYFISCLKNLPSDYNDEVIIYDISHGCEMYLHIGRDVNVDEVSSALNLLKFGEAIVITDICHAGGFIENLNNRVNNNENMLLIGVMNSTESGSAQNEILSLFQDWGSGTSTANALTNYVNNQPLELVGGKLVPYYHPVIISNRNESFLNPLAYIKNDI
jgi:hypothetical protein